MQTQQQGFVSIGVLKRYLSPELVISSGLCSECFSPLLLLHDGRWLCPNCKIEYDGNGENIEDDRVPFPQGTDAEKVYFESHFNPTNSLGFNGSLGTNHLIRQRAICRILSRKNGGDNRDLGLRSKIAKIVTDHVEPQGLRNGLQRASEVLKCLNFGQNPLVADATGKLLRKSYAFLAITAKKGFNVRQLADSCVYYVLTKYGYEPTPPAKIDKNYVSTNILKFEKRYLQVLRFLDTQATDF